MKINRRIGIVIGQLTFGGAENQVYELATGLTKSINYDPIVICYSNLKIPCGINLEKAGVKVIYLMKPRNYVSRVIWIRKALLENNCKIAYAFLNPANIYCWIACLGTDVINISSIRGIPNLSAAVGIGLKAAYSHSEMIISNSNSGKHWAENKFNIDPNKIVTVANSVRQFSPNPFANITIRQGLGIETQDLVIGLLSNIKKSKCPNFTLDIAIEIINSSTRIQFIWVGDGPLFSEILMRYKTLSDRCKSRIHFVGAKENPGDWFSSFNIFMLISKGEGLSNALMEAMSFGLPCICSDVPGITDTIENKKTGILVSNTKEDWIKSLNNLIQDKDLQHYVGKNAKIEMFKFSSQALIKSTTAIFDQVISQKEKK